MATLLGEPAGPRRAMWVVAGLIAVVALAAVLVAVTRGDDDPGGTIEAGGGTTTSTEATTTTTATATTTTTVAVTTTTKPAVTTTAAPTTTAAAPASTFKITPSSGPPNTQATASGTGCTGADAGVTLTFYDPSGKAYNGDGGGAQPDGTWSIPFSFSSNGPAGRHRAEAKCINATTNATYFNYPSATFTVT